MRVQHSSQYYSSPPIPSLILLPAEIHENILPYLTYYPDILALKLTHSYFYHLVQTTLHDRVDWLLDRNQRGLPKPLTSKILLGSDVEFCSNPEVALILRHRWQYRRRTGTGQLCPVGIDGGYCPGKSRQREVKKRSRSVFGLFWAVVVAALAFGLSRFWRREGG